MKTESTVDSVTSRQLSDATWRILACSQCGNKLNRIPAGAACSACETVYYLTPTGALDLRLKTPKRVALDFEIGTPLMPKSFEFEPLELKAPAEVDFSRTNVPWHLTRNYYPTFRARAA